MGPHKIQEAQVHQALPQVLRADSGRGLPGRIPAGCAVRSWDAAFMVEWLDAAAAVPSHAHMVLWVTHP